MSDAAMRRHHRGRVIRARVGVFRATTGNDPWRPSGYYGKRSPYDCGRPHCPACRRPRYGPADRQRSRRELEEIA